MSNTVTDQRQTLSKKTSTDQSLYPDTPLLLKELSKPSETIGTTYKLTQRLEDYSNYGIQEKQKPKKLSCES